MAKHMSIEEAVERAQRAQDSRIQAIRALAEVRQNVVDVRESCERELVELQANIATRIGAAERDDVRAFNAAISAGWTPEELRKIGFAEPEKKTRARRRASKSSTPQTATATPDTSSGTDDQNVDA